ncbi:hypothetical protein BGZ99_008664 [Dissophora globulifera]|uniref:F-box domain-containing protein n=1 Tax=Dissophora globulifera TaxID=979702 RepID=A0A9P6R919_9FUNG|nr:hypothetical protein BGZ99_008664 [Dissophora globulifera]
MEKALNLPEILGSIGHFLPRSDLLTCLRVCKAWKLQLEPRLWRRFRYYDLDSRPPSEALINQNAKYIHFLNIEADSSKFPTAFFAHSDSLQGLTLIRCPGTHRPGFPQWCDALTKMISNNPQLRRIVFHAHTNDSHENFIPTQEFVESLRACSRLLVLETSEIYYGKAGDSMIELYMRSSVNTVRRLATTRDIYSSTFTFPDDLVFKELRYFDIRDVEDMTVDTQLTWISRCPNLISLHWSSTMNIPVGRFIDIIPAACPHLTDLHLLVHVGDKDIARILESLPRIEKLSVTGTSFGKVAFQALKLHFSTFRDINLQSCYDVTGAMVHEILCSCPNLQSISADEICNLDMPEEEQWVCNKLQMFDVGIYVTHIVTTTQGKKQQTLDTDKAIYKRLAQLTQLEYLSVSSPNPAQRITGGANPSIPLSVALIAGLGELKTLKRLRDFSCKKLLDVTFMMGGALEAVQWMVENWPSLECLEAVLGSVYTGRQSDEITINRIMTLLQIRGIEFKHYEEDEDEEDEEEDEDEYYFEERINNYMLHQHMYHSDDSPDTYDPDYGGMPNFGSSGETEEGNYWDPDLDFD